MKVKKDEAEGNERLLVSKTRKDLAAEYGISPRTLRRRLKKAGIQLHRGKIMPADLKRIYATLGEPEFKDIK